jgi:hypothetical protein
MEDEVIAGAEQRTVMVLPDRRVSFADGGAIMGRTPKTMANWRSKGWGPRPIMVGGRGFYSYDECLQMARGEKSIKPEALAA